MRTLARMFFLAATATTLLATAGAQPPAGEPGRGQPPGGPGGQRGGPGGQGQGRGGPGGGMRGGMAQPGTIMPGPMMDQLKLSEEQKKMVEALQKDVNEKLAKILTEDQMKQLKEMGNRGPGGPGGPGGQGGRGGRGPGGPGGQGGPGGPPGGKPPVE